MDDILLYSRSSCEHEKHLQYVLQILKKNKLYAKESKCEFFSFHVEYLGFIISKEDLFANPKKMQLVVDWPIPNDSIDLKGSYGLWDFIDNSDEVIF